MSTCYLHADGGEGENMKPKEVLELAKKHEVKFVDLKFIDFPGVWQHTTIPATRLERGPVRGRPRVRRLVHPRMAAHQRVRHGDDPGRRTRRKIDPFYATPDAERHLLDLRPDHQAAVLARPAPHRQEGRGVSAADGHRATRRSWGPRPSSSSSTTCASTSRSRTPATTTSTATRAPGTAAARSSRTSATRRATRRATSPSRRPTRSPTSGRRS